MDFVIHGFLTLKLHRPLSGMVQTKQALPLLRNKVLFREQTKLRLTLAIRN